MKKEERERLLKTTYRSGDAEYWKARARLADEGLRVFEVARSMLSQPGGDIRKFRFVERLAREIPIEDLYTYNCDWREDEDGCFELCFMSAVDAHDYKPGDEEYDEPSRLEARELADAIEKAGAEVVSMSDPEFWGYSEYTPDPGDVRLVKVKLK